MTKEEAKEIFLNRGYIDGVYDGNKWREACIVISEWLEEEPTTKNDLAVDCISRQAVLDLVADYDLSMSQVVKGIHALPPITPQEPILDKIRAEIEQWHKEGTNWSDIRLMKIEDILDKYKAESEE